MTAARPRSFSLCPPLLEEERDKNHSKDMMLKTVKMRKGDLRLKPGARAVEKAREMTDHAHVREETAQELVAETAEQVRTSLAITHHKYDRGAVHRQGALECVFVIADAKDARDETTKAKNEYKKGEATREQAEQTAKKQSKRYARHGEELRRKEHPDCPEDYAGPDDVADCEERGEMMLASLPPGARVLDLRDVEFDMTKAVHSGYSVKQIFNTKVAVWGKGTVPLYALIKTDGGDDDMLDFDDGDDQKASENPLSRNTA
eukprot:TRINITY_DN38903_c0_g1_i1.p2 TRINITY_DN38903_c0_g1~~TRINITY_DN38903_c0_g1_i1.p2  ORF type:complete len:261 (+),score=90.99 TRINITY_DN38903_c0_g1_i1:95-877(+)